MLLLCLLAKCSFEFVSVRYSLSSTICFHVWYFKIYITSPVVLENKIIPVLNTQLKFGKSFRSFFV